MTRRRDVLIALGAGLVSLFDARAQTRGGTVHRIGVLLATPRATYPAHLLNAFDDGLRQHGLYEGKNLIIERRYAEGRQDRLPTLAAELVTLKVDLLVTGTDVAALAAKNATGRIPIVFVAAGDPVGVGLVKGLARPGGNVTGFASFTDAMVGKQLELLREVVPRLGRLAVIHSSSAAASPMQLAALRQASVALKLRVSLHDMQAEPDLDGVFRAIEQDRPEALQVLPSIATFLLRTRIAEFAAAQRLPAIYGIAEYVEAGGLMSYSFSFADNWRRAASYVDRILKGAKPANLPVQQPTKLELAVNLKTAKAIGIAIPQSILLRADRVIE